MNDDRSDTGGRRLSRAAIIEMAMESAATKNEAAAVVRTVEGWHSRRERVEAENAELRAENERLTRERYDARDTTAHFSEQWRVAQERAERAEAEVERMRPVVTAAEAIADAAPDTGKALDLCERLCDAVYAMREATSHD